MGENQLFFGRNVFEEAIKQRIPIREVFCANSETRRLVEKLLKTAGRSPRLNSSFPRELAAQSHQGVAFKADCDLYVEESLSEELINKYPRILLCNHLEDIQNLGGLARSAAAFGFGLLVHEKRRSVHMNPVGVKISAGQAFRVKFMEVGNLAPFCRQLRDADFELVGLEADPLSKSLYTFVPSPSTFQITSGKRDLNPRPPAWKAGALATELLPHYEQSKLAMGLEPATY